MSVVLVLDVLGEPELGRADDSGALHGGAELLGGYELPGAGEIVDAEGEDDDVGVGGVAVDAVGGGAGLPAGGLVLIEDGLPLAEVGDAVPDEHAGHWGLLPGGDGLAG